jgi:prepilin-type processing-associated H-X9-DG protein/prepilin-type N-terminal cleavage/methylation domain-containing protein
MTMTRVMPPPFRGKGRTSINFIAGPVARRLRPAGSRRFRMLSCSSPSATQVVRRKAFTLVELLVVIGIIAVLISILMPALSRSRQHANRIKCAANLHQMGLAMTMYLNQWRAYPGHAGLSSGGVTFAAWPTRLRGYMNNNRGIFHCPSQESGFEWQYRAGTPGGANASQAESAYGYDVGETLLNVFTIPFSYGYNDWGASGPQAAPPKEQRGLGGDLWIPGMELKMGRVRKSAEMIAIADNTQDTIWDFNIDPRDPREAPGKIHEKGCNVLFCDGHVSWFFQQDVVLFDVRTNQQSPSGNRYNGIVRMWNNDNEL